MPSRLVPVVAVAAGLVLGLLVVLGVVLDLPVLTAAAAAAMGVAVLAVQVDSWRRTRSLRIYVRDEIRRAQGGDGMLNAAGYSPVTQDDVVGAVRLMQAQYTGRLDRMQRALDAAIAELKADRSGSDAP